MIVIGLMSGTSADGIDAAVADLRLMGDELWLAPLAHRHVAYPPALQAALDDLLPPTGAGPEEVCRVDAELGQAFAAAASEVDAALGSADAELVVSHGQTVHHWVDDQGRARGTLQLGQPAWIAEATGLPVVADLRSRDLAAGGQGAPLVAYPDVLLLAGLADDHDQPAGPGTVRALLNIGGIANLTLRRADGSALAFDIGPGNALIDAAVRQHSGGVDRFDADGRRARRGEVHPGLLAALLADPYYRRPAPKSTGKERFHRDYLADHLRAAGDVAADDVVATLTALTAETIARAAAEHDVAELVASGGGTRNPALMDALADRASGIAVRTIDQLGVTSGAKEACWFAALGFCTLHGLAATLPSCTGARHASVLGSITPGAAGLPAVEPATAPRRLRVVDADARRTS